MKSICIQAAIVFLFAGTCFSQVPRNPRDGLNGPADRTQFPYVTTHIPSAAGGESGIAVGVLSPLKPRYSSGVPVVIHVPGGADKGATEGPPEYAGLGFVEIRFAFPGGGRGTGLSGGSYDHRGPDCIRALADVIRFATGRLADKEGRKIQDLVPHVAVLASKVGIVGSSHGGNACGLVMATHGEEFPDLAFYASMESPYGEGNVSIELGGRDQGVNPAYHPETGALDLSKLAWSADLKSGPPRRWQNAARTRNAGPELKGAFFFDLNGDGQFSESTDFPANVFVQDFGKGPKAWYSPRLIREAESRKLLGDSRPDHMPSLEESTEYWRWRDAAGSIAAAVRKCPNVAVIVYANERDHVQVAPDHPHILTQVEGFRAAGCKFVRLNPDKTYIERVVQSGGANRNRRDLRFADNDAGTAWDRSNIRTGLEPEALPMRPYMQAAVAELADRTQAQNWSKNLDTLLYVDAPWESPAPMRDGARPRDCHRPPLAPPPSPADEKLSSAPTEPQSLHQHVAEDAGSPHAPLLFCIGVHVEPLGATVSGLVKEQGVVLPRPDERPGPRPRPSYENEPVFHRHIADLKTLADIVERHSGKLTIQAQTPFTRRLVQSEDSLMRDLAKRGHEIALHFHENAHLGSGDTALPPKKWTAVMCEEMDWLKKTGAEKIRYWSGGNLYPGVLDAAANAGLDIMSDYKNPHTQRDNELLLSVNPWRPAAGPTETDLSGFAKHSPAGKIIYLPNGVFDRVDHSAMRRSAESGGDFGYFDALTKGLELSLRATSLDHVNVFHVTVHPGEFRGGPKADRPFAVIEDWLSEVVDPLVKAGKVRWATFSEMADAYKEWEKKNADVPSRIPSDALRPETTDSRAKSDRAHITFVANVHDFGRVDKSADTVLRLVELFAKYKVKGDFYLTAPVVEAYAGTRPEVIKRLRDAGMTISYHFRPPHRAYTRFDAKLRELDDAKLRATLQDYERFHLDLATGDVQRDRPGGYAYVKEMLGTAPVCVSALSNPRVKSVLLDIYHELGAQMTMEYHESGTKPDQPFVWKQGLLIRPSDFSITRWTRQGEDQESFWWNRMDSPQASEFNPTKHLQEKLAQWAYSRTPLITAIIHENDFYVRGGPSWQAIYHNNGRQPHTPPYDLNVPDQGQSRTAENQEAIWRAYEELVEYASTHLNVITSADVVQMAGKMPSH